jgi:hypothetical protein
MTLVTGEGVARAVFVGLVGVGLFMVRFRVVAGGDDGRDTVSFVLLERAKPCELLQAWMNYGNR